MGGVLLFEERIEVIVEDDLIQIKKRGTYVMFSEGGGWGGDVILTSDFAGLKTNLDDKLEVRRITRFRNNPASLTGLIMSFGYKAQ